jgi:hypothetical protein
VREYQFQEQAWRLPAVVNELFMARFAMTDKLRRAQGDALDALGLGPRECAFQLICSGRIDVYARMAVQTQGHCCSWCRRQSNDYTSGTSLLP